jgi:hypothetical protein
MILVSALMIMEGVIMIVVIIIIILEITILIGVILVMTPVNMRLIVVGIHFVEKLMTSAHRYGRV